MGKYIFAVVRRNSCRLDDVHAVFQLLLLGGYLYSHVLSTMLAGETQAIVHLGLLALSVVAICLGIFFWKTPLLPGASWKPTSPDQPVVHILGLLAVAVGLPYLVLSTTGPLLQSWFSLHNAGTSPYRLYALSNTGSVLGLITYPIVFEPMLRLHSQSWLWCVKYRLSRRLIGLCPWHHEATTVGASHRNAVCTPRAFMVGSLVLVPAPDGRVSHAPGNHQLDVPGSRCDSIPLGLPLVLSIHNLYHLFR